MRSGVRFGDVLDGKLGESQPDARVAQAAADYARCRPALDPILLFFDTRFRPAPPPRPRRTLSARQDRALRSLVELGAPLDDAFTDAELRSAFRALAMRYHPDRHPGSSAADVSGLAARFAALTDAYRELVAA
jgi:hypothetical protein